MSLADRLLRKGRWLKPDLKALQKKMAELAKKRNKFWKPRDGRNVIRILPAAPSSKTHGKVGLWYHEMPFHYGPGTVCLTGISKKGCPVCKYVNSLLESSKKSKVQLANKTKVQVRILFNIVDMTDDASKDRGVQIFAHSETTLNKLLAFVMDPEWGDLTDPKDGYDIIIEKTNESGPGAYKIRPRRNSTRLGKMAWLKQMKDLRKVHKIPTYLEAKERLLQWKSGDTDVDKFKKDARRVQSRYED